ncbi:MAG: hypothetical protein SGPRY_007082, partial [Prymnesium sp.]
MRNRPMKAGPAEAAVLRQLKRRRRRESSGGEEGGSIEWFIYGNYDAYYGYRHLKGAVGPEPRVLALREEWFRGRECLDVGCNAGQLTLSLATRYNSASFLGVDIDAKLISRARTQLNAARSANSGNGKRGERVEPSATERGSEGGLTPMTNEDFRALLLPATARGGAQVANASAGAQDVNREVGRQPAPSAASLPRPRLNVRFEHCNFWVHLNFGDEGIRTLFSRVFACLRPGGHFIFEPQPWSSYRKASSPIAPCK